MNDEDMAKLAEPYHPPTDEETIAHIEEGLAEARAGNTVSHEDVLLHIERLMRSWKDNR